MSEQTSLGFDISQVQPTDTGAIVTTSAATGAIPKEWEGIEARPLDSPDILAVKIKNTALAFRWVNHKAAGGRSYAEAVAKGFRKAQEADCENMCWDQKARCFQHDDVLLMCLPKREMDAALAFNWIKGNIRVKKAIEAGKTEVSRIGIGNPATAGKIQGFVPASVNITNEGQAEAGAAYSEKEQQI